MSDVFISYSRKDIAFARLLRESLQQSQVDTWIDWERIPVGEKWWTEICEAIENANVFMFIISRNSIGSSVCKDEIKQALKNNKRIIPIIVDELKPDVIKEFAPELPQFNWIIFARDHIFHIEENPEKPIREDGRPPGGIAGSAAFRGSAAEAERSYPYRLGMGQISHTFASECFVVGEQPA